MDPNVPDYVRQRHLAWVHEQEQKLAARDQLVSRVVTEPRPYPILDVLRFASRCGLRIDPDEVLAAIREGAAQAEAERAEPVRRGPHADLESAETPVETDDEVTDETATESGNAAV
jgi:hypothetical protein